MGNYNVAIVGCGRIARHNGQAIEQSTGMTLSAVCDIDGAKAQELGTELGVPFFSNYHQMLRTLPDIELISICTPSGMHFEHAKEIIEQYGKNVIVEKPTFMALSQLSEVYEIAERKGVSIYPVFQNRYNKAVRFVRSALDNNDLGKIRLVNITLRWCRPQAYYDLSPWRGTFSHDGGVLTNQGIHHVDLLRYLGGEISQVYARMTTLGASIEVEDTAIAMVEFSRGALGSVEVTTAARPDDFEASITIVGAKGLARIGGIAVNELQIFTPDSSACPVNSEEFVGIKGFGAVYGFGHGLMYEDIFRDLEQEAQYPISRKECEKTLSLLHAFYCSDELNEWVNPQELKQSVRLGRRNEAVSRLYRVSA